MEGRGRYKTIIAKRTKVQTMMKVEVDQELKGAGRRTRTKDEKERENQS